MMCLLAVNDMFDAIQRYVNRTHHATPMLGLAIAAACAVSGIWVLYSLWQRFRKAQLSEAQTPYALFVELCDTHALGKSDRHLLSQVGTQMDSCRAFIDPQILGRLAVSQHPRADDYARLGRKLFGVPRA